MSLGARAYRARIDFGHGWIKLATIRGVKSVGGQMIDGCDAFSQIE